MNAERVSLVARVSARIRHLRLDVELDTAGGTLVLVGPNGAGKSSLLACLLGVHAVERGHMSVGANVLFDTDAGSALPLERRRLGYVPQNYGLFPHLNVRQNIEFALASAPARLDRTARARRVAAVLRDLGLEAHAEQATPTLSGGERQRVALARALSVNPCALLLDEPLAALDARSRPEVRGLLAAYLERLQLPCVVVTHDPVDARQLGRRIAVLEAGRITQLGTWQELVARPASRYVEDFVSGVS